MKKGTNSFLKLAILVVSTMILVYWINGSILKCDITPGNRFDYVEILGIMCSVIFITTSLLATLSNKEDTVYYENATEYVLINPPIFNFYGLSVLSYITLGISTLSVVFCWFEVFSISFVLGISFVIILFFKMTMIYFRRDRIKEILAKEFESDINEGNIEEAKEKINHLYLNSLNAVDNREFDTCADNLFFLQTIKKYPEISEYSVEVIKKLLVHISSNDLFYFTRIVERFQDEKQLDSFLDISSIRHHVAQLLIDKVQNENDMVIGTSLYRIYEEETVRFLKKASKEAIQQIRKEIKRINEVYPQTVSSMEEYYRVSKPDPREYDEYFGDMYDEIENEYRILAEVMVLYEPSDEDWIFKMNEICSLPNVLNELWCVLKLVDPLEDHCRIELSKHKHFVEFYIERAVFYQKPLLYVEHLLKRYQMASNGVFHSKGNFFKQINPLLEKPEAGLCMHRRRPAVIPEYGEFDIHDYVQRGICNAIVGSSERRVCSDLLQWIWPCFYSDYAESEPDNLMRLKQSILWMIHRMIPRRNVVGLYCILQKLCADVSEYNYKLEPKEIIFESLDNKNVYVELKKYSDRLSGEVQKEIQEYLKELNNTFINQIGI